MNATVKVVKYTGFRFVPKGMVGKTGKVRGKVKHHDKEWLRVSFKEEQHSFSHMCFGNPYYDFLEEELEIH